MAVALASFDDFDALLVRARIDVERLAESAPDDVAIESVRRQLADLHAWTRGGRCPSRVEKDSLDLRRITGIAPEALVLAAELDRLANFVSAWSGPREG